jgi:hypothetical protein
LITLYAIVLSALTYQHLLHPSRLRNLDLFAIDLAD